MACVLACFIGLVLCCALFVCLFVCLFCLFVCLFVLQVLEECPFLGGSLHLLPLESTVLGHGQGTWVSGSD